MDQDETPTLTPLPKRPDGFDPRECQCRWCWLWGWLGPLPTGTPTARTPMTPRAERTVKKSVPQAKKKQPTLFDHEARP